MEYVLTFKNTNFAIKAEQRLLAENLKISVMPLPPEIRAGCGVCLRVPKNEIDAALKALSASSINETELYERTLKDGKFTYNLRIGAII